jgi:hypothetical protein
LAAFLGRKTDPNSFGIGSRPPAAELGKVVTGGGVVAKRQFQSGRLDRGKERHEQSLAPRFVVALLLFATALPLVQLAGGAAPAVAACVSVTGANGSSGWAVGGAGGAANAWATTSGVPSNCATATGGTGGPAIEFGHYGGPGGAANSTATTSIYSGAASAEATSFGGTGGAGIGGGEGHPPRFGGAGGPASSSATATSTTGSASATASSTGGRPGYGPGNGGFGSASADAAASSARAGQVQADASAVVGGSGGSASASANARNQSGSVVTTAAAPNPDGPASALSNAAVGSGSSESLVTIAAGQAVSNAILTPSGPNTGVGAMSAAYGGSALAVTYEATATFDFKPSNREALDLKLLSDNFVHNSAGIAFDSMELLVVHGTTQIEKTFSSLSGSAGAETYFTAHPIISLGTIGAGSSQSIEIEYFLGYNSGTSAVVGDGFGFTYDLATAPVAATPISTAFDLAARQTPAVPEPSTWAMMLMGFAALAFAGYRARVGSAVVEKRDVTDENGKAAI